MEKENYNKIVSLIANVREKANRFILNELRKNGIDALAPSHGDILQVLFHTKEGVSMQELAKRIDKDKSTVTALVNKLVKLGYVQKLKSLSDSRVIIVVLTQQGWELEPIFHAISQKLIETIYKNFSEREKKEVIDALEKLKNNL